MEAFRGRAAALALVVLAACAGPDAPPGPTPDLAALLPPAAELAGWTVDEGPDRYVPDTLYEYLDGGADRYLAHGFKRLVHVRYRLGDDPAACVTLDLYDMGGPLGAFGIYSAARTPAVEPRPWGDEGYRTGSIAAAWKGPIYIHGEADDERPELIEMLEGLVAGACSGIEGEASPPSVLKALPSRGLVARSERVVPSDLLGHAFLPGGVVAVYELDGRRSELFFSDIGDEEAATRAFEALVAHLARRGIVEDGTLSIGDGGIRYAEPTLGEGTVVRSGRHLAGIHGGLGPADREAILAELVRGLPP